MDYPIRYWEENTNFDELRTRVGDKKIAIWGAYITGKYVRKVLRDRGFTVSFYIDGHKNAFEYDGISVIKPSEVIEEDIYIFIAVIGVRKEIIHYLNKWNMNEKENYVYISKALPQVIISECTGGYADCNGNRLEFEDEHIQCKIEFKGFNSKIKIGRDFVALDGTKITVESGCEVTIGDYVHLQENVTVEVLEEGRFNIGNNCLCYKDSNISCKGAEIDFGNFVTIGKRFFCTNGKSSIIDIGDDCMFSHDVSIISGGHSIFDMERKENVSMKKYIKIGNHVWLGKNVVILHNADIGNGCIVGASSVVKLKVGENCVIAGNPAKVIKQNHTWDRRHDLYFEDL